jgi:hypothetical protein
MSMSSYVRTLMEYAERNYLLYEVFYRTGLMDADQMYVGRDEVYLESIKDWVEFPYLTKVKPYDC